MLLIRLKNRRSTYMLAMRVTSAGNHGIWDFHQSASSYITTPDYTPYRHAAILPADPKEGQTVTLAICKPGAPEEEWFNEGEGIAAYYSEG